MGASENHFTDFTVDGVTLIPFERGKALIWGGTVVDTLALSYVDAGNQTSSTAVSKAETLNNNLICHYAPSRVRRMP